MTSQKALGLLKQGRFHDAKKLYIDLLKQNNISFDDLLNLFSINYKFKLYSQAIESLEIADRLHPDSYIVKNNLGICYKQLGSLPYAINLYKESIQLNPNYSRSYYNLANSFKLQNKFVQAIYCYLKSISLDSSIFIYHYNLANTFSQLDIYDLSIYHYEKSLSLSPKSIDSLNNLALVYTKTGNYSEAISIFMKSISIQPVNFDSHYNLANSLRLSGQIELSLVHYKKSLKLNPLNHDCIFNQSIAYLLLGLYPQGLVGFESRFKATSNYSLLHSSPIADNYNSHTLSNNKAVLILSEQGLGDTIHFVRYCIILRKKGIPFKLSIQSKLHSLIISSGIVSQPLSPDEVLNYLDLPWIPLMSLPRLLDVTPERPLLSQPYLKPPNDSISKWKRILRVESRPIIGINWQADPKFDKNAISSRSIPLSSFRFLSQIKDLKLISLQKGFGSEQFDSCNFKHLFVSSQSIINSSWSFLDTAAIISNCDLVITVDTSVAHLAGALGKETYLLLKYVPDWRWGLVHNDTFWYPTIKLFRQSIPGKWDDVFERLSKAVAVRFSLPLN